MRGWLARRRNGGASGAQEEQPATGGAAASTTRGDDTALGGFGAVVDDFQKPAPSGRNSLGGVDPRRSSNTNIRQPQRQQQNINLSDHLHNSSSSSSSNSLETKDFMPDDDQSMDDNSSMPMMNYDDETVETNGTDPEWKQRVTNDLLKDLRTPSLVLNESKPEPVSPSPSSPVHSPPTKKKPHQQPLAKGTVAVAVSPESPRLASVAKQGKVRDAGALDTDLDFRNIDNDQEQQQQSQATGKSARQGNDSYGNVGPYEYEFDDGYDDDDDDDQDGAGRPLFDESAYSAHSSDDEYSAASSALSGNSESPSWKARHVNDFFRDLGIGVPASQQQPPPPELPNIVSNETARNDDDDDPVTDDDSAGTGDRIDNTDIVQDHDSESDSQVLNADEMVDDVEPADIESTPLTIAVDIVTGPPQQQAPVSGENVSGSFDHSSASQQTHDENDGGDHAGDNVGGNDRITAPAGGPYVIDDDSGENDSVPRSRHSQIEEDRGGTGLDNDDDRSYESSYSCNSFEQSRSGSEEGLDEELSRGTGHSSENDVCREFQPEFEDDNNIREEEHDSGHHISGHEVFHEDRVTGALRKEESTVSLRSNEYASERGDENDKPLFSEDLRSPKPRTEVSEETTYESNVLVSPNANSGDFAAGDDDDDDDDMVFSPSSFKCSPKQRSPTSSQDTPSPNMPLRTNTLSGVPVNSITDPDLFRDTAAITVENVAFGIDGTITSHGETASREVDSSEHFNNSEYEVEDKRDNEEGAEAFPDDVHDDVEEEHSGYNSENETSQIGWGGHLGSQSDRDDREEEVNVSSDEEDEAQSFSSPVDQNPIEDGIDSRESSEEGEVAATLEGSGRANEDDDSESADEMAGKKNAEMFGPVNEKSSSSILSNSFESEADPFDAITPTKIDADPLIADNSIISSSEPTYTDDVVATSLPSPIIETAMTNVTDTDQDADLLPNVDGVADKIVSVTHGLSAVKDFDEREASYGREISQHDGTSDDNTLSTPPDTDKECSEEQAVIPVEHSVDASLSGGDEEDGYCDWSDRASSQHSYSSHPSRSHDSADDQEVGSKENDVNASGLCDSIVDEESDYHEAGHHSDAAARVPQMSASTESDLNASEVSDSVVDEESDYHEASYHSDTAAHMPQMSGSTESDLNASGVCDSVVHEESDYHDQDNVAVHVPDISWLEETSQGSYHSSSTIGEVERELTSGSSDHFGNNDQLSQMDTPTIISQLSNRSLSGTVEVERDTMPCDQKDSEPSLSHDIDAPANFEQSSSHSSRRSDTHSDSMSEDDISVDNVDEGEGASLAASEGTDSNISGNPRSGGEANNEAEIREGVEADNGSFQVEADNDSFPVAKHNEVVFLDTEASADKSSSAEFSGNSDDHGSITREEIPLDSKELDFDAEESVIADETPLNSEGKQSEITDVPSDDFNDSVNFDDTNDASIAEFDTNKTLEKVHSSSVQSLVEDDSHCQSSHSSSEQAKNIEDADENIEDVDGGHFGSDPLSNFDESFGEDGSSLPELKDSFNADLQSSFSNIKQHIDDRRFSDENDAVGPVAEDIRGVNSLDAQPLNPEDTSYSSEPFISDDQRNATFDTSSENRHLASKWNSSFANVDFSRAAQDALAHSVEEDAMDIEPSHQCELDKSSSHDDEVGQVSSAGSIEARGDDAQNSSSSYSTSTEEFLEDGSDSNFSNESVGEKSDAEASAEIEPDVDGCEQFQEEESEDQTFSDEVEFNSGEEANNDLEPPGVAVPSGHLLEDDISGQEGASGNLDDSIVGAEQVDPETSDHDTPLDIARQLLGVGAEDQDDLREEEKDMSQELSPASSDHVATIPDVKIEDLMQNVDSESEDGSSSNNDSDEGGSDSESSEKDPYKLVIKEAPLLRLENVTSMTRGSIEVKSENKNAGGGRGWGWFGFAKKDSKPISQPTGNVGEIPKPKPVEVPKPKPVEVPKSKPVEVPKPKPKPVDVPKPPSMPEDIPQKGKSTDSKLMKLATVAAPKDEVQNSVGSNAPLEASLSKPQVQEGSKSSLNKPKVHTEVKAEKQSEARLEASTELHKVAEMNIEPSLLPIEQEIEGPKGISSSELSTVPVVKAEAKYAPSAQQVPIADELPAADLSPKQSKKKKKKKEKADLAKHLNKRVRRMNRHGDEVSVGTMNNRPIAQNVVLAQNANLFNDFDEQQKRPWEATLPKRNKRKGADPTPSDPAGPAIDDFVSEGVLDITSTDANRGHPDAPPLSTSSAAEIEGSHSKTESDAETSDVDGARKQIQKEGSEVDFEDEERDELASLVSFSELEKSFNNLNALQKSFSEEKEEVNFDDMWDTVSCDGSTALDYEVRKREKERAKEKKKTVHAKVKAEKHAKATPRLRLFENESRIRRRRKENKEDTRLSSEFLTAIQRVFDDDDSLVSGSDDEETVNDQPEEELTRQPSLKSLYISTDASIAKSIKAADDENEVGDAEEDDDKEPDDSEAEGGSDNEGKDADDLKSQVAEEMSVAASRASASVTSQRSKRRKSSRRDDGGSSRSTPSSRRKSGHKSKSLRSSRRPSRSRQPDVDPAAIFEAELKRQQGAKILSISSLKEEMITRRGTTVKLLEREFAAMKKKSQGGTTPGSALDQLDFNNMGGNFASGDEDFFASRTNDTNDPFAQAPPSPGLPVIEETSNRIISMVGSHDGIDGGLSSHLSRWAMNESFTNLDDLKTVIQGADDDDGSARQGIGGMMGGNLPSIAEMSPHVSPTRMSSLPGMPISPMASLTAGLGASISNLPIVPGTPSGTGGVNRNSISLPSPGGFSFNAGFNDMPLTTITEAPGAGGAWDDENDAGLLASPEGWDDGGGGGGDSPKKKKAAPRSNSTEGRFSFGNVVGKAAAATKGLESLKKVKSFIPKIPKRSQSGPSRMEFINDNDERGLLG